MKDDKSETYSIEEIGMGWDVLTHEDTKNIKTFLAIEFPILLIGVVGLLMKKPTLYLLMAAIIFAGHLVMNPIWLLRLRNKPQWVTIKKLRYN